MIDVKHQTPGGFVLFCDDVREETSGKKTLVGCYSDAIIVAGDPPVKLPRLAAVIYYYERPGESQEPAFLCVSRPGNAETLRVPLPVDEMRAMETSDDADVDDPIKGLQIVLKMEPCDLSPGRIRIWAERGDMQIRLGTIRVEFQPQAAGEPVGPAPSPI